MYAELSLMAGNTFKVPSLGPVCDSDVQPWSARNTPPVSGKEGLIRDLENDLHRIYPHKPPVHRTDWCWPQAEKLQEPRDPEDE